MLFFLEETIFKQRRIRSIKPSFQFNFNFFAKFRATIDARIVHIKLSILFQAMSFQVLGGIALVPALENITKVKDLTTARVWSTYVNYAPLRDCGSTSKLGTTAGLR